MTLLNNTLAQTQVEMEEGAKSVSYSDTLDRGINSNMGGGTFTQDSPRFYNKHQKLAYATGRNSTRDLVLFEVLNYSKDKTFRSNVDRFNKANSIYENGSPREAVTSYNSTGKPIWLYLEVRTGRYHKNSDTGFDYEVWPTIEVIVPFLKSVANDILPFPANIADVIYPKATAFNSANTFGGLYSPLVKPFTPQVEFFDEIDFINVGRGINLFGDQSQLDEDCFIEIAGYQMSLNDIYVRKPNWKELIVR